MSKPSALTERQRDVLSLSMQRKSPGAIAEKLGISRGCVNSIRSMLRDRGYDVGTIRKTVGHRLRAETMDWPHAQFEDDPMAAQSDGSTLIFSPRAAAGYSCHVLPSSSGSDSFRPLSACCL